MLKRLTRRRTLMLATVAALLVTAFAAVTQAQAATIYACVKKNGSAHIFNKKPKCAKHETALSWNTTGPAGKNGANGTNGSNGTNGTNGTNGAVAGYSAFEASAIVLDSSFQTVVEKSLPTGSFIVAASVELDGYAESAESYSEEECILSDTSSSKTVLEVTSYWGSPFFNVRAGEYLAQGAIPFHTALTTTAPSKLLVRCREVVGYGNSLEVEAANRSIVAVQTSANS